MCQAVTRGTSVIVPPVPVAVVTVAVDANDDSGDSEVLMYVTMLSTGCTETEMEAR